MEQTIYYKERQKGYKEALKETKKSHRSSFENQIKLKLYKWWAEWKPDYEGWLKVADTLYADSCKIDAIGPETQIFKDYKAAMKHQRDAFSMDMGPIEQCVVENDTVCIFYKMYMTFKGDMFGRKQGDEIVLKVTEFNTFDYVDGYDEPMVVHLNLITTGF